MTDPHVIPIFPLGIVALPGMPIPLHIFEPRYKEMVRRCMDRDIPFGVVYFSGNRISGTGCTVRILQVIRRYDDGRLDILTRGEERFVIHRIFDEKPYLEAAIEPFDDLPEPMSGAVYDKAGEGLTLLKDLVTMLPEGEHVEIPDASDPKQISFLIAGSEGFTPDEKQRFLEMTSTVDRLEKSIESMTAIVRRLRLSDEIKRIIGGNGHMSEGLRRRLGAD